MRMGTMLLLALLVIPVVGATMNCTIKKGACTGTDMFHMSAGTNAHAEQNNETNYEYKVCCTATQTITENCTTTSKSIINLSTSTNAHIELANESHYTYPICLSTSGGTVNCTYQTSACSEACLGKVSGNTNAHIENCTSTNYGKYLCCSHIDDPTPPSGGGAATDTGVIFEKREESCTGIWVNGTCVPKKAEEAEEKIILTLPMILLILFGLSLLFLLVNRVSKSVESTKKIILKKKDEEEK